MHALIVYAHPEPKSFTGALKDAGVEALRRAGHTVEVSDLYAEAFDPVAGRHDFTSVLDGERFHYQSEQDHAHKNRSFAPDVAREQDRVTRADLIVWVYPIWWGGMPAIMKGWFERVLAFGFAYADGFRFDTGYFRQKRGIQCLTTGGTRERFSAGGVYGPIDQVLWPTQHCMIEYMGMAPTEPFVAYASPRIDEAARKLYLKEWSARVVQVAGNT